MFAVPYRNRGYRAAARPAGPMTGLGSRSARSEKESPRLAVSTSITPSYRIRAIPTGGLRGVSGRACGCGDALVGTRADVGIPGRGQPEPGDGLDDRLTHALGGSATLILLASKNSAASPWVRREVEYWRGLGRHEILIAHTGEGIVWPLGAADFDWDRTHGLSEEVFGGTFTTMPAWVNLARARRHPRLHASTVHAGAVALAAAILGVEPQSLLVHERRRLRLRAATAVAAAVAAVTTVVVSLLASHLATQAYQQRQVMSPSPCCPPPNVSARSMRPCCSPLPPTVQHPTQLPATAW